MTADAERVASLLAKAERDLVFAEQALDFSPEQAARMGYMTVFHSALAAVRAATGAEPKTHTGLRSVFGELAVKETLLGSGLGSFLAKSYESKDIADYQTEYVVDRKSAEIIVTGASNFLANIKAFIQSRMADR